MQIKQQSLFTLLLVCIFAVFSAFAQSTEETFCGCSGNACCELTPVNFNLANTLATGTDSEWVQTVDYGNFSAAFLEDSVEKSNLNVFAFSTLSCTDSYGYLIESTGDHELIAEAAFTQVSSTTCNLNFSTLISDEDLRKDLDLVIAFNEISEPLGTQVFVQLLENIVPFSLPTHRWVVEDVDDDSSVVDVTLNIQINPFSGHESTCLEEANAAGMKFQFLQAVDAPGSTAECNFVIDAVTVNAVDNTVRMDYEFAQADYVRCYRQTPEQIGSNVRYTFEVVPDIDGCDYYEDYQSHIFTITLSDVIQVNATTTINSMQLDRVDDGVRLVPCSAELDDIDPLVPLARLEFNITVETAYGFEASSIVVTSSFIEDLQLDVIGDIVLTQISGTNTRAEITLRTSECLFVDTIHSGTPASQANLVSCSVDYLQPATVVVLATYSDGFTESNDLQGADRDVVFESDSLADCAGIIVASNDVSNLYGAQLVIEDQNGRTDSLNLNNEIIARVELTNVALAEETGVSVVLNEIIVTLDDEYRRTYRQSDKINQMQLEFSPYYQDGHFCRFFVDSTDTCTRFYQQTLVEADYATSRWNAFLQTLYAEGPTGFFVTEGASRKYDGCQDLTTTSADSFVFTPSDWVFRSFPRKTGIMFFEATAYLRSCSLGGSRRLGEIQLHGYRDLQNNNQVAIVFNNVTIINSDIIITPDVTGSSPSSLENANEGLLIALIVLISIFLLMLTCSCCCGAGFLGGIYSRAKAKVTDL
jgi:hypothetical protein